MAPRPRVGFIGLGRMGRPMATRLLRAGFPLTVWNRSREAVEALAALGARPAGSPAETARASEILLTSLPGPADVAAVLSAALPGAAAGSVFVDTSTIDPDTSRRIAGQARARGVEYLDASVSGGVTGAAAGTLTLMVGGAPEVLERCRPILRAIGKRIFHLGPVGSGNLAKLCNQVITGITYAAVAEALVLGAKGGLDPAQLLELLSTSSGRSRTLEQAGPLILDRAFEPAFTVDLAWKDLECALAAAERLSVPLALARAAQQAYVETRAQGWGGLDQAAVILPLERSAGVEAGRTPA